MIDTIVFRIHDLRKHDAIFQYLHKKGVDGQSRFVKDIPHEDVPKKVYNMHYWHDWSTGRVIEEQYRSHLPSYHYDIAFCINIANDYIEFNFSIPKYLYITNVFQFVPHHFDADYSLVYGNDIKQRGDASYDRLKRFLNAFFEKELGGQVDWYCVHIVRLDLCFNKLFGSKEEALRYMKDLKRIKKKHSRDSKVFTDGDWFGLYYVQSDYTFKIYHKGAEFQVHDKNVLKKQGLSSEKIELLQHFADRMVRYEVEFRTGMMDRLWKRDCFRKGDKKWRKARRFFIQYAKSAWVIDGGKKFYRHPPVKDENGKKYSAIEFEKMKMSRSQMDIVKYGEFYANKTFHFYLKSDSNILEPSQLWDAEINTRQFSFERDQRFSRRLFRSMIDFFLRQYKEFSIEYQENVRYVVNKVKDLPDLGNYNREREFQDFVRNHTDLKEQDTKRINLDTVDTFLKLLQDKSLSEIKALGIFKDRTFYRYKKLLIQLGFTDYTPSKLGPKGDDTFTDYFWWVDEYNSKLNFDFLFKSKF